MTIINTRTGVVHCTYNEVVTVCGAYIPYMDYAQEYEHEVTCPNCLHNLEKLKKLKNKKKNNPQLKVDRGTHKPPHTHAQKGAHYDTK